MNTFVFIDLSLTMTYSILLEQAMVCHYRPVSLTQPNILIFTSFCSDSQSSKTVHTLLLLSHYGNMPLRKYERKQSIQNSTNFTEKSQLSITFFPLEHHIKQRIQFSISQLSQYPVISVTPYIKHPFQFCRQKYISILVDELWRVRLISIQLFSFALNRDKWGSEWEPW